MMPKIYDISADRMREATQEDIDLLIEKCIARNDKIRDQKQEIRVLKHTVRMMEEHIDRHGPSSS